MTPLPRTRDYHYVITLQQPARGLTPAAVATYAGVTTLDFSATAAVRSRNAVYLEIFAKYAARMQAGTGHRAEPATLFFDLQPDRMEL